jgi:formate-dependent nitrite reductase cytochrome c552 subunit
MHQLRDIILTAEEERQIQANLNPIRSDFMINNQGHKVMHTPANMKRFIRQLLRTARTARTSVLAYSDRLHRCVTI